MIVCVADAAGRCGPQLLDTKEVAERLADQVRSLGAIGGVDRALESVGFLARLERTNYAFTRDLVSEASARAGNAAADAKVAAKAKC